jgi:two-component system sensor histidine kinase RegB
MREFSPPKGEPGQEEGALWLTWLVRLRWVALFAQVVTLSFTFSVLDGPWVLVPLLLVMAVLAATNVEAVARLRSGREVTQERLFFHLATEVLALAVFLAASGGPKNPFVILFLVHVCMGAVMLTWGKATWITSLAVASFLLLWAWHLPLRLDQHSLPPSVLLDAGSILAFMVSAVSASAFTIGVARTLRAHKVALLEARDRTAKVDRLRTVGTLAAGAAHELNTPLFTMNLRLRRVRKRHTDEDTQRDVEVIQTQLDRCKEIVEQLLVGAGDPSASGLEIRPLSDLVQKALSLWSKGTTLEVRLVDDSDGNLIEVPPIAFRQALINLLENGRQAQETNGSSLPLEVTLRRDGDTVEVRVRDHGCGLPENADRVGDPFFTTKDGGTGLGVYVARAVADGAGGGLRYREQRGSWTEAIWWFPSFQGDRPPGGQDEHEAGTAKDQVDGRG